MKIKVRKPLSACKDYYTINGEKFTSKYIDSEEGVAFGWLQLKERRIPFAVDIYTCKPKMCGRKYSRVEIVLEEWHPSDGELVWAWDSNTAPFSRCCAFYDAMNHKLFDTTTGKRNGQSFRFYEPYSGKWPDWAVEAYKKLEI
jgi:hypothetical protein